MRFAVLTLGLLACAKPASMAGASPQVTVLSAASVVIGPTDQTSLLWKCDTAGSYVVAAVSPNVAILARGTIAANAALTIAVDATSLAGGANQIELVVIDANGIRGDAFVSITVGGAAASGGTSSGSTSGSSSGGGPVALGGTVSGFITSPLTPLTLSNGTDTVSVGKNGAFVFPTKLAPGDAYSVAIAKAPLCPMYDCQITGATGIAPSTDVSRIAVACSGNGLGVPPRLLFTDIVSGPNSGGDNGNGAYVMLYGVGFGATTGAVTIGGKNVLIQRWGASPTPVARGLETILIQLGPNVAAGALGTTQPLVVTPHQGVPSNALDFSVRASGTIYFVNGPTGADGMGASQGGSDSHNGLSPTASGGNVGPFLTLGAARAVAHAGDIVYLQGTFLATDPQGATCLSENAGSNSVFCVDGGVLGATANANNGSPNLPIAYVGYPGKSALFANPTSGTPQGGFSAFANHYVVAELSFTNIQQSNSAIDLYGTDNRAVGNTITSGQGGTIRPVWGSSKVELLGNLFQDLNAGAFFLQSSNSQTLQDIDVGYNEADRCRTLVDVGTFGDPGDLVAAVRIHDNATTALTVVGIATFLYTSAEDLGFFDLQVDNNVITDSACFNMDQPVCAVDDSTCVMHLWNNTCGVNSADGGSPPSAPLLFVNRLTGKWLDFSDNLFFFNPTTPFNSKNPFVDLVDSTQTDSAALPADVSFAGNFYGSGSGLSGRSWDASALTGDPGFYDLLHDKYTLSAASRAIDAGALVPVITDFRGVPRPQGKGFDIGAFEYCPGLDP